MPNDWMIYGREKGKGKFRPFTGQGFTGNIIHAMRWPESEGERIHTIVEHLNEDNPGYEFEARRAKGTIFAPAKADKPWLKRNPKRKPWDENEVFYYMKYDSGDLDRFLAENPQYTKEMVLTQEHVLEIFTRWMHGLPNWESEPDPDGELQLCLICNAYVQVKDNANYPPCPICGNPLWAPTLSDRMGEEPFKNRKPFIVLSETNAMELHDCRTDYQSPSVEFVREYKDGVPQSDCILLNQADYCDYEVEFDRDHQDSPREWKAQKGCEARYVNGKIAYTKTSDPKKVHELNRRPSGNRWARR